MSNLFKICPNDILLSRLSAYGLSNDSVNPLKSYLTDRKQLIKLSGIVNLWSVIKMCPTGFHIDPTIFL